MRYRRTVSASISFVRAFVLTHMLTNPQVSNGAQHQRTGDYECLFQVEMQEEEITNWLAITTLMCRTVAFACNIPIVPDCAYLTEGF